MMSNSLWQRGNTNEGREKKTEKKQGCLGKKTIRTDGSKVKPHKLWSRLLLTNTEHTEEYNWIPVFLMLSVPPSFSPSSSRITSSSSWPLLLPCWSSSVEPYSFSWSSSSTVCKSVLTPVVITVLTPNEMLGSRNKKHSGKIIMVAKVIDFQSSLTFPQ